jgi:hypothetical protein
MTEDAWNRVRREHDLPTVPVFSASAGTQAEAVALNPVRAVPGLTQLVAENEQLRRRLEEVTRQNARLRGQLAQQVALAAGSANLDHSVHEDRADRYRNLVQQSCQRLARAALGSATTSPRRVAQEISTLCRKVLLDRPSALTLCLTMGLSPEEHIHQAAELLDAVATVSDGGASDVVWDFELSRGRALDPSRQVPWGSCDSAAPVQFVVAPAYCVDDRVYAKQLVFAEHIAPLAKFASHLRGTH